MTTVRFDMPHSLVVNRHAPNVKYDFYVGRGTPWGNPFRITITKTRKEVIEEYRKYFYSSPDLMRKARMELRGKVLACSCAPRSCHADIIAEYANA